MLGGTQQALPARAFRPTRLSGNQQDPDSRRSHVPALSPARSRRGLLRLGVQRLGRVLEITMQGDACLAPTAEDGVRQLPPFTAVLHPNPNKELIS